MTKLHTVAEIVAATGGRAVNVTAESVKSVSIDSRDIAPGALFVAIKGDRLDGHDYVRAAIEAGAAAALVSEDRAQEFADLPVVVVPDAFQGLIELAKAARARSAAKIVAVTGSAGKTTTRETIRMVLAEHGPTHAAIKSLNNHWGVPLTLARLPRDAAYGVFEIGMSAPGEIVPLTGLVKPDIAVITTIAPAHMENFDSLDDIARAKAEIFAGLGADGTAVVNTDHPCLEVLRAEAGKAGVAHFVTYGASETADVRITDAAQVGQGMQATIVLPDVDVPLKLASPGMHRLANATAAMCVARAAGLDPADAARTLAGFREPDGRGAILELGPPGNPLTVIDESYNANPVSMAAALEVFGATATGAARIVVLGDMLELGSESPRMHAELKQLVLNAEPTRVFLVGTEMAHLRDALGGVVDTTHADSVEDIAQALLDSLDYGDTVMVKGSNSIKLHTLVSRIRDQFDTAAGEPKGP